ncbi:flagellar hook-basal body protein [Shouchella shacheensis]|uniref:flagellar hook-basal body protein n=1 Tax=Shouchella shacheensis TaxID=1649580 RepID=UPI00073FF7F0|nr:flagellar hook-basal body protein [Shouchella shacheensis]
MLRGFYTAASGMLAEQQRQDMLAHNLANAQTPGYKADQSATRAFPTMLLHAISGNERPAPIGELSTGVYMQEQMPNFRQGDIKETGNSTDVSIVQTGGGDEQVLLFAVQTEGGIRYTRNGNLQVDSEGRLATTNGWIIQSTDGTPIQVDNETFTIDSEGVVTAEDGTNRGTIEIVVEMDPMAFRKEGDGLYSFEGEAPETAHGNAETPFILRQNALEQSNVNPAQTMNDMLSAYRLFEANQKVIQAYDQSMDKVANEVGRLT